MFEHAKAEIPNDNLLEELITSCNQAGYDGSLLMQLPPIFLGHDLQLPDANDRHIEIVCSDQDSLNIKYCPNMPVKQLGKEICRVDAILEFTLKFRDSKVEYENGKVTFAIPEQLENYKADGKSLLDEINRHFKDEDNRIIDSLVENIGEGPKSFVVDLPAEVDSFDVIPENAVFDLGHILELVKKAMDDKDVNALANHIGFVQGHVTHIPPKEGLPVVEKTLEIVSGFTKEQGKAWNCHPTVPIASYIYSAKRQYYDGDISQEDYEKLKKLEETLYEIKSDLIKRSSNDPNEESPVKNAQDTSAILNETPTSSQAVNQEDNNQLSTKESKSTDSQQVQKSIIDKGENIMNNEEASIEEAIGNNCEEGKMPKNIEEKLSSAVSSIDLADVMDLLRKVDDSVYKSTLQKLLGQANEEIANLEEDEKKKTLTEMIVFLKQELENIPAASSQEVPVVERKESEPDSLSLSSEDDDFSKLEGDDSARVSSDSPSFEMIDDEAEVSAPKMPLATERAETEPDNLNDEEDDQQNLTVPTVSSSVSENIGSNSASEAGSLDDYYSLDPNVDNDQKQDIQPEALASEFEIENVNTVNQSAERVEKIANEDTLPEPTLPAISKQSSESNQKTTALNTKKYVVAAAALAIAGIVSGVAVAVYLEMLAVGIAVAACCLIAATVIYSYGPKSLVEDNEIRLVSSIIHLKHYRILEEIESVMRADNHGFSLLQVKKLSYL
ncbi:unnamed protein product [Phyllotreta striolata]|uniref:Uncharacterized protein n=1 Tax=Phyllotreta striolata TaxID=444603 RepID=A0A9N9U1A8_PHYSR|nr:unnamed protein product [Phyllotreta striolata]